MVQNFLSISWVFIFKSVLLKIVYVSCKRYFNFKKQYEKQTLFFIQIYKKLKTSFNLAYISNKTILKGFNPPPEKSFSIQKNLTEEELLAINNAKEEAKIRLKLANEERKTKRALAAEKRKHDVERKRREKEDKKLKEADEERRREIMRYVI